MGQPTLDVVGIGNAMVDVLSHELDDFVERLGLAKGAMTLVDADRSAELYDALAQHVEVSGGSAANTLAGVAAFGGRAGYIGLVHDDALGVVFAHDMRQVQVSYSTPFAPQGPTTGRCIIVVTPDAERTMSTYLGASSLLGPADLDLDLIRSAKVVYLEGYLFDSPTNKDAFRLAAATAHEAGRQVALTLSDSFCVDRHRDDFLALVTEGVDLLFANEAEITSLFEVETFGEAVDRVRGVCEIACLTQQGARGSVIVTKDDRWQVPAAPIDKVVDTTAAGDLYAAGVLYGYTAGMAFDRCGQLGSLAAAAVIGQVGARPGLSLVELVDALEQ